jgi:hypothetical protein
MIEARYDKHGRRLPDTGHGCGCRQCAEADAPRYERRRRGRGTSDSWSSLRRELVSVARRLGGAARRITPA